MSGFVTARWIILCLRMALGQSSTVLISVFALYWCPGHSELPVSADFPSLHPWMGDREEVEEQETAFEGSFGKSPAVGCCLVQVAVSASVLGSLPLPMTQHGRCGVSSSFCSFRGLQGHSFLADSWAHSQEARQQREAGIADSPSFLSALWEN